MPRRPLRALILVRLSVFGGVDDPTTSPARQEAQCRAYCDAKEWQVVHVVKELDVSGSEKGLRLNRPGLNEIREWWGQIDVVVFAKLDRLTRSVIDFRAFAEEAKEQGAVLVSVAESLDMTSAQGRAMATIIAAFAELEAATIAQRTKDGMLATRKLGRWAGGQVPFGYEAADNPNGPGRVLVINPDEASVIREAASRLLAGESAYAVTRFLNDSGFMPRKAKHWSVNTAIGVLTGETVQGRIGARQYFEATGPDGEPLKDNDENPVIRSRIIPLLDDTGQIVETAPPILTPDEVAAIRATRRTLTEPRGRKPKRLLSGFLICAGCGYKLILSGDGRGAFRYRCMSKQHGRPCDSPTTIKADDADKHVEAEYLEKFGGFHLMERRTIVGTTGLAEAQQAESAALRSLKESATPEAFEALQAAQARLRALEDEPPTAEVVYHDTGQTLREAWPAADIADRRGWLVDALETGTIEVSPADGPRNSFTPSRLAIEWRTDDVEDYDAD